MVEMKGWDLILSPKKEWFRLDHSALWSVWAEHCRVSGFYCGSCQDKELPGMKIATAPFTQSRSSFTGHLPAREASYTCVTSILGRRLP